MVRVERTFTVNKGIEQVVEYLADFAHATQWDPGTRTCTPVSAGPVGVGSTWRNVSVFRGRETELSYRLLVRENDHLVFEGNNKTATSTDDLTFTEVPGGTSITYRANIAFHGLVKLVGWVVQKEFDKLGDQTVGQMTRVLNGLTA